jgi:hypothetical protein
MAAGTIDALSHDDLKRLAGRCADLKSRLVKYATALYLDEHRDDMPVVDGKPVLAPDDARDMDWRIDDYLHTKRFADGRHLIERFVAESPHLSQEDSETALGWRDSVVGVFHLRETRWPLASARNLVDDLEYRLFCNNDSPSVGRALTPGKYVLSRVVPARDAWMLSGRQILFKADEGREARGCAAGIALRIPRMVFRNQERLDQGREMDRKAHERFVERFGGPWVVGAPALIEGLATGLLTRNGADRPHPAVPTVALPDRLRRCRAIGMVSDPLDGLSFLADFDAFLGGLHDPSRARGGHTRQVLLGYLDEDGAAPIAFDVAARHRPRETDALLAALLDRPGLAWSRDREEILRERNPGFLDRPRWPTWLPLTSELAEGKRYLDEGARRAPAERARRAAPPGRNDPCHCGSGKKYKQCCLRKETTST